MIRKILLLSNLLLFFVGCFGQSFRWSYEPGFGTYRLDRVKKLQLYYAKEYYAFPIKAVELFPNYLNQSMSLDVYLNKHMLIGINGTYLTTGARNASADYSGNYRFDMLLSAWQIGAEMEQNFNLGNRNDIFINFKAGIIQSVLDLTETIEMYDVDNESSTDVLVEQSFFMEPNVGWSCKLTKRFAARVGVGLNCDFGRSTGKLIDWTGLRTRIGISYSL